jgi:hypothetical protein
MFATRPIFRLRVDRWSRRTSYRPAAAKAIPGPKMETVTAWSAGDIGTAEATTYAATASTPETRPSSAHVRESLRSGVSEGRSSTTSRARRA